VTATPDAVFVAVCDPFDELALDVVLGVAVLTPIDERVTDLLTTWLLGDVRMELLMTELLPS